MVPETEGTPRLSPWRALVDVITEPGATFQALEERMPIFPGYLLQMVAGFAAFVITAPRIFAAAQAQIAAGAAGNQVPPEMLGVITTTGMVVGGLTVLAAPWLAGLFVSLIAMLFGMVQGGAREFTKYLGMVGYARLPLALATIVSAVLLLFSPANAQKTASLSLAVLASRDASPVLLTFLRSIGPFEIWYYALLAIGFAALHRTKPARALSFALGLYVVSVLFSVAGVALSQAMSRGLPGM